jgi:UDP-N-acetylglucosamine 2-epimerase (non-hydrolysing)
LATLHFAATPQAASALQNEAISNGVSVTGNTGIDALLSVCRMLEAGDLKSELRLDRRPGRRLIVVTTHRRESFGPGLEQTCKALARLASRPDVQIALPVHPNPNVRPVVEGALGRLDNVQLLPPLGYVEFVDLMRQSWCLLTDSGGIQEEAPSLGKPVLVLRNTTERPEAIDAGAARLVGTDADRIVSETELLLDDAGQYRERSTVRNPFGDGRASERISAAISAWRRGRTSAIQTSPFN